MKKEITNILKQKSEFLIHRTRQCYYLHGARSSHLLAMRIRASDQFADIPAIKSTDGTIRTDPCGINQTFQTFYSKLYESEVFLDKTHCARWLNQLDLPQLSAEESTDLDKMPGDFPLCILCTATLSSSIVIILSKSVDLGYWQTNGGCTEKVLGV